jgi:hypothetical protein
MPFPFTFPTTSHLTFQTHLTSTTHPSLPSTATSHRILLRSALKSHKRLPASAQSTNLPTILSALQSYIPYLFALDSALSARPVAGEDIDVTLIQELTVEWRPTLSSTSTVPGRDVPRVKGRGLDYEIYSVLHTFSTVSTLLARNALLGLYASTTPEPAQRLSILQSATKHLTTANSIHLYLVQRMHSSTDAQSLPAGAVDVSEPVQAALAALSHAEATLLFVQKDDPYPALLIQSRNKNDREWMIKAPEIPRVRVGLLARLCLSAAEGAGRAVAGLKSGVPGGVSGELVRYCEDLRKVSRAKACRFLGIEREMEGKTGEGIAWLRGGMVEVGMEPPKDSAGVGFGKLRSEWKGWREDKRLEKGKADWGLDAGKAEEGRVLEWLERKWTKMNDTTNVQIVPDWQPLAAAMPSGRDALTPKAWVPDALPEEEVARMRAPPEVGVGDDGGQSSDEEDAGGKSTAGLVGRDLVGAFPGTGNEYRGGNDSSYY